MDKALNQKSVVTAARKFVRSWQIEPGTHLLLREGCLSPAKNS